MSDDDGTSIGSGKGEEVTRRVGNAERDEAVARLAQHWKDGRLDPGEHELRVTRARAAVTQADLDALFTDLSMAGRVPVPAGDPSLGGARGLLPRQRDTIMALMPFVALVLFFTTGDWVWFLMVPVTGILMYGPGGTKQSRQRGH